MPALPPMRSRHTPRLPGYDYTQSGLYFVTVVTAKREYSFGEIRDEMMQRNLCGDLVSEAWLELPSHFSGLSVLDFVVMPNHVHGIFVFDNVPHDLSTIIGGFKSGITRRINTLRDTPGESVWQRSYYDRIVRSEAELIRIQEYIAANPIKWAIDSENPLSRKLR